MLENIHVKNFALIDEVEINLSDGLNILTGETGAGKSIIIDAVNFALGGRVSKDVVRDDCEYALSELIFSIDDEIKEKLKEYDIPMEDSELIFTRKIMNGKSSARINGETVPATVLKNIAAEIIDIHGQHDNQSLLNKASQLNLLDSLIYDKISKLLDDIRNNYVNYNSKLSEYEELVKKDDAKELSFLTYQLEEIDAASLVSGEDEELEALYRKMSSAKKIAEAVSQAHYFTGYDSDGAGASVGRALLQIRQVAELDDGAKDLALILTDIDSLLNDFNRTVADYEASLEFSDEQFYETESRINVINSLKSKYGNTITDILEFREKLILDIEKLQNVDEYKSKLKLEIDNIHSELLNLCEKLSDIRSKNAKILSDQIANALLDLNFLDSQFEIKVTKNPEKISAKGFDDVELLISTNPGEKLKPLSMVASGGEMSRIMLAIKSVMANTDNIPTLIFDEIDTGISGRTAQKVSEKMAMISRNHQVICVTHLPQIAAMADNHYEIKKDTANGRTLTSINLLSDNRITDELARMLGGVSITDAVIENAKDMKKQAIDIKNSMR